MPLRFGTSYMRHGKRVRVWFEAKDDSREAEKAASAEMAEFQRARKAERASKVTRQAFRKEKSPKDA